MGVFILQYTIYIICVRKLKFFIEKVIFDIGYDLYNSVSLLCFKI